MISTQSIYLAGSTGNSLTNEIKVQAEEKKPVFAYGVSSAPWLKVGKTILEGRIARIPIIVPAVPSLPGERLQARVDVTANGNQRFTVEVTLSIAGTPGMRSRVPEPVLELAEVSAIPVLPAALVEVNYADVDWLHALPPAHAGGSPGASAPPAAIPLVPSIADLYGTSSPVATVVPLSDSTEGETVLEVIPVHPSFAVEVVPVDVVPVAEAVEESSPPGKRPWWIHLLPLGFLALCLLVTLVRDLWMLRAQAQDLDPNPRITLRFHDQATQVTIARNSGGIKAEGDSKAVDIRPAIWEPSMRFGLLMLNERDRTGQLKRLTYQEPGTTNNTVLKLDGQEWIFGERPFREMTGKHDGDWPGRWQDGQRDIRLPQTAYSVEGRRSTWVYDAVRVEVIQTAEIVRGSQSNLLDTCLVRYQLHNKDNRPHKVGIRFLLDTFIGGNDGVPFLIPGAKALCSTSLDFKPEQIPDFIQALEYEDLARPGTIAQVGFRVGGGLEPPSRVTLGAWPSPELRNQDARCRQEKTLWEVPVLKIHTLKEGDSAVTMYWHEKELAPGQTRDVGFSYGLGNVSGGEGAGKLALTVGGSFAPRGEFTVTAYVSGPVRGETVTLTLPDNFELIDGKNVQPVPLPDLAVSRNSPVTWRVRGPRQEGTYSLKVDSSTGVSQTQSVKIRARGIFGE